MLQLGRISVASNKLDSTQQLFGLKLHKISPYISKTEIRHGWPAEEFRNVSKTTTF